MTEYLRNTLLGALIAAALVFPTPNSPRAFSDDACYRFTRTMQTVALLRLSGKEQEDIIEVYRKEQTIDEFLITHAVIRSVYALSRDLLGADEFEVLQTEAHKRCATSDDAYVLLRWLTIETGADPFSFERYEQ